MAYGLLCAHQEIWQDYIVKRECLQRYSSDYNVIALLMIGASCRELASAWFESYAVGDQILKF